jgi:hypothetical protein
MTGQGLQAMTGQGCKRFKSGFRDHRVQEKDWVVNSSCSSQAAFMFHQVSVYSSPLYSTLTKRTSANS